MASSEFEHHELNSTPKLSLHLLPNKVPDHPLPTLTTLNPPTQTVASVPFKWEEAPGKPRPCTAHNDKPKCVKSLDLPPRLLPLSEMSSKVNNMPSPTTVLDGPYKMGRTMSFSSSLRKNPDGLGSRRWSSFRKHNHRDQSLFVTDPMCSIDFSSMAVESGTRKVNRTKVPRRSSFLSLSQSRSHLLASIYESLKLVVPWRRRQQNVREVSSQ